MVMPYKPSSIPTGTTIIPAVDSGVVSSTIFIGSNTLVDVAKYWASHIHKNRLVGIAGQLAVIQDNTANTLTIKGAWSMAAGTGTPYAILGADFMQVLRDVFGGGFDINAGNPLQVFDPKVWGSASGLILSGTVTVVPGADQFTIPTLAGLGAGKFSGVTKPFRVFVFRDAGGASAAPQGQMQTITAYNTISGTFTAPGFAPAIDNGDEILILNPRLAEIADILAIVAGGQADFITEQSEASTVEQNAIQQFNIALFSLSTGAIPLLSIDITGISQVMSRSRAGGAFSAVGITPPVFTKGAGTVYCPYQFLLAEWEMGDLYKLVVSGIKATIGINTFFVPDMVWSNAVIESADLETTVNAIETEVESTSLATGAGSNATLTRLGSLVRWIVDNIQAQAAAALAAVAFTRQAGVKQVKTTTIDLNHGAGNIDLFTGTAQDVILESLVFQDPAGVPGGVLTAISIQTNDATPAVIIPAAVCPVASLLSEAQFYWTGRIRMGVGKKIQLTIYTGAAGGAYSCNVVAGYRAVVSGGTLA